MGSLYLTRLGDWCRAAGLRTIETDGWQTRARGSGGYEPGRPWVVMWHHTASQTSPENDVGYIVAGCPDAPVANLYLARDGAVYVCAAGATNTNGKGGPWRTSRGTVPVDQMNTYAVSIEAANNGTGEHWPVAQIDAYFALSNELTARLELTPTDLCTHAVWSPTRKIDPARAEAVDGDWWPRASNNSGTWVLGDVQDEAELRTGTLPPPPPPFDEEDDMKVLIQDTVLQALFTVDGVPVSAQLRDALVAQGYVIINQDHAEWRDAMLEQIGPAAALRYGAR